MGHHLSVFSLRRLRKLTPIQVADPRAEGVKSCSTLRKPCSNTGVLILTWGLGAAILASTVTILASTAARAVATVNTTDDTANQGRISATGPHRFPSENMARTLAQLDVDPGSSFALPDYAPREDGFRFSNQGMTRAFLAQSNPNDWVERLTATLPALFGTQVCLDAEAEPCILTQAAQNWLSAQVDLMAQGLCDGIAAANLMLWHTDFASPQPWWRSWLSALSPMSSYELSPKDSTLQELVAQQAILQGVDELYLPTQTIRETFTPNDILAELINTFRDAANNPSTLGLYRRRDGQLVEGHTLLPYRIDAQENGQFRVYVYDSNLPPGDTPSNPYIAFDTRSNTWSYSPGEASGSYQGDADSQNLDFTRLNWRSAAPATADGAQGMFTCPFCAASQPSQKLDIALIGEGDLAVYRLNPATNDYVSVKQSSDLVPFKGGLDRQVPSRYSLTSETTDPPLKIVISGKDGFTQPDLALQITGAGYTADFKPEWREAQDTLTLYLAVRAGGPELTFVADQDTVIPNLAIYLEDEVTTPPPSPEPPESIGDNLSQQSTTEYRKHVSYSMEIGQIDLPAGHAVALSVDRNQKRFYFADNSPNLSRYTLNIQSQTKEEQKTINEIREDFADGSYEVQILTERRNLRYREALKVIGVELTPQTLAFFDYGDWARVPTDEDLQETIEQVEVPIAFSPAGFSGPTNTALTLVPQTATAETRLYRGNLIKSNYR